MTVIDASVLVDAFTSTGPPGVAARRAIRELDRPHAPHNIKAEAASAVRRMLQHNTLGDYQARSVLDSVRRFSVRPHPVEPLLSRIWELRDTLTVYDAWYVALAERLNTKLVTADRKLAQAPGIRCEVELVN